ncbi:MAG: hypothetical protein IKU98_02310 [Bacteroidaceae bacterium]|nr:hypothetical protein [Bacteroidaceae bacterium]
MLKQVQHDEMMEQEEGKDELLSNSEKSVSSACSASSVIKESENSRFKVQCSMERAVSVILNLFQDLKIDKQQMLKQVQHDEK